MRWFLGLDLDYEATRRRRAAGYWLHRSTSTAGTAGRSTIGKDSRDYDWLVEMVDEETGSMAPITDLTDLPRQPRFVFTRQPAWLRVPTEAEDTMIVTMMILNCQNGCNNVPLAD